MNRPRIRFPGSAVDSSVVVVAALLLSMMAGGCAGVLRGPGDATSAPPPTAQSPAAALPGSLAYLSEEGNIYTIAPDGGDRTAVTSDGRRAQDAQDAVYYESPTWAPESNRLAFIRIQRSAGEVRSVRLQVTGPDSDVRTWYLGEEIPFYLYWSPAGDLLSFLTSGPDEPGLGLRLASGDGRARVLDRGQPYYWDWAPNGSSIFAHVGGSSEFNPGAARLSALTPVGAGRRDLELQPAEFQAPAYSPDGQQVLVTAEGEAGVQLLVLDPEGGVVGELAPAPEATAFAWAPDGDQVAYVVQDPGDPLGFGELRFVELEQDGSVIEQSTGLDSVAAFFWSPNGRYVAAFVPEFAPEDNEQQVSRRPQIEGLLLHLHLVRADDGDERRVASFRPTDSFVSLLPFYDQYQRSSSIWAPNGEALVYTARMSDGSPGVYVLGVEPEAQAELVAEGTLAFWSFD